MKLRSAIVLLALTAAVSAEELPRKMKAPRESYPNVDVIYDSVTMPDGKRLRSIITRPRDAKEKLPVIFLTGWLSCDSGRSAGRHERCHEFDFARAGADAWVLPVQD